MDGVYSYVTAIDENSICVGVARVGADDQQIKVGTLQQLCDVELGPPLHSLVIAGTMHPLEISMLKQYVVDETTLGHLQSSVGSV